MTTISSRSSLSSSSSSISSPACWLGNAFSLQMLEADGYIKVSSLNAVQASELFLARKGQSCVGHPDTAAVVSDILGINIPCARVNVTLHKGDILIVAQLTGGRLPEGATKLPDGFKIKWKVVSIE